MTIKEFNKNEAELFEAETFRLEYTINDNQYDKVEMYFGNFLKQQDGQDAVKVLTKVTLPVEMAVVLVHGLAATCAEYQFKTGNNVGIPDEVCKKMVEGD